MRYAVLSDIHGNLEALTAVMDTFASASVDRYLCLGDSVGYGADPVACLERLQQAHAVMVSGNHEAGGGGRLELDWFSHAARAALIWTRDQLGMAELEALRRLPMSAAEGPCTLVHATLSSPERFEYLVDVARAVEMLAGCPTLFCLAGHTHVPTLIEYDRTGQRLLRVLTNSAELTEVAFVDASQTHRYLLNPGSVGQPRDGDPRASGAIIDTAQRRVSVHRILYDVARASQKIHRAGLPSFLADRLLVGR